MAPTWPAFCASFMKIEGIERIRFLTSHPNYFTEELMEAVAELAQGHAAHRGAHPGRRR